ncbi:MAG: N-acetylmuramoyl-L-alanine amidase [Bacteroidales bacterium]|nr:N-acetylmuramoyl-L-alanine amidase [Bacteroidales bacterium]
MKNTQTHIIFASIAALLVLTSGIRANAGNDSRNKLGLNTVCIDAGHGGTDPGCVSKDKKTYESKIALDIAKRLSEKIKASYPTVKVVMTRSTDKYITLGERADIANRNNANLFISIHVNMAAATSANGYSIHVLGQSSNKNRDLFAYNMDVCKRENSVIMLEDDYSTKYQGFDPTDPESFIFFNLMQNAHLEQSLLFAQDVEKAMSSGPMRNSRGIWQDPFFVLWKTAMPAALIEVGFMSNATDLATLKSESGREKIAQDIFVAFGVFKKRYDGSVNADSAAPVQDNVPAKAAKSETDTPASAVSSPAQKAVYGTQVLASGKLLDKSDPFFKGYPATIVKSGSIYKYIIGTASTTEKAKENYAKIRKSYSGCFMVVVKGDMVTILK